MPARNPVIPGAFLVWTLFVWGGRIRNALSDDSLAGWDRTGPVLLAASFVVPAVLVGLGWFVVARVRHAGDGAGTGNGALGVAVLALAGWTTGVWVVRAADIVLGGDHALGFVIVHTVLAAVSMTLAALVASSVWGSERPSRAEQVAEPNAS
jgi:hypothetical protein